MKNINKDSKKRLVIKQPRTVGYNKGILTGLYPKYNPKDKDDVTDIIFTFEDKENMILHINDTDYLGIPIENFDDIHWVREFKSQMEIEKGGFDSMKKAIGKTIAWYCVPNDGTQEFYELDENNEKVLVEVDIIMYVNFKSFDPQIVGMPAKGIGPNMKIINNSIANAVEKIKKNQKEAIEG